MQNPILDMKGAEVLEYTERPYKNKQGEDVVFREVMVRYSGKVLKFGLGKDVSFAGAEGKIFDLSVSLETFGESLKPTLRVVLAKPVK